MKRAGPFTPSVERQQILDQGTYALQSMEDRSVAAIRSPFSDLHQFIIRREAGLHKEPGEQPFHRQAIPVPLLFHSPTSLYTARWLTPSSSQRVDMNLKSVVRFTESGTQQGDLMGIPASGKRFQGTGISIARHDANGKTVEVWISFDFLGMMQQLGVISTPGQAS